MKNSRFGIALAACLGFAWIGESTAQTTLKRHTFSIGDEAFLLDGKPFVIRTGEMHFTRVPHEYWRHRLQLLKTTLKLAGLNPSFSGSFTNGGEMQEIKFPQPVSGSQFCLETLNAHGGKAFAAVAEFDILDPSGNSIPHREGIGITGNELISLGRSLARAVLFNLPSHLDIHRQDAKVARVNLQMRKPEFS